VCSARTLHIITREAPEAPTWIPIASSSLSSCVAQIREFCISTPEGESVSSSSMRTPTTGPGVVAREEAASTSQF
jgi:hypothetical protein